MSNLTKAITEDRKLMAEKLKKPLAALFNAQGRKMSDDEVEALILDENTIIEFPTIVITTKGTTTTTTTETTTTTTTTEYV